MGFRAAGGLALLFACGSVPAPRVASSDGIVVRSVRILGSADVVDIRMDGPRIAAITPAAASTKFIRVVTPAFIDAHVHLAYLPRAEAMLDGGVAAVVDLAAPEPTLDEPHDVLRIVGSGPMLTAPDGYPTQGWGRDGYGTFIRRLEDAAPSVDRLHRKGARVVKIPFAGGPTLDDHAVRAIVERAHEFGMLVFVHALSNAEALRAGRLGADVLAHTPIEPLTDETVALWKDRAVVTTAAAFGGGHGVVPNLRALRSAGTKILYGTDFGNSSVDGINRFELKLLVDAGFDAEAIVAAATATPARCLGLDEFGAIEVGRRASFLLYDTDPSEDPTMLAKPDEVWIDGRRR